jgi:N-dimethylarginine dimethylaminohydrolase
MTTGAIQNIPAGAISAWGGQSMTAKLRTVMVRRPAQTVGGDEWQSFGYTRSIKQDATVREHRQFTDILRNQGIDVIEAGPDPTGHLDAIFAYDPSLVCDAGAVLLRPGKDLRRDEPKFHQATYEEFGIPILGSIVAPGTVEGGDTLWIDEKTLAIGRGYRTNFEGIRQLSAILSPHGIDVVPFDLPYGNGPSECLHLMSMISPIAEKTAVIYRPIMAVAFFEMLRERGWTFIDIPQEEFDTMGCNVLALGDRTVIIANRNPETVARMQAAGFTVIEYEGDHISHNRQGGPTCLTRPILRRND